MYEEDDNKNDNSTSCQGLLDALTSSEWVHLVLMSAL